MKVFSKKFLTDEHIKLLRESRKIYAKDKIVKHGDNYIEVVNFEKRMKVYPPEDELLDMINNIERFDAEWNCVINASWDEYRNYRYEDLPSKLKSYMREMDNYYFAAWYSKKMNSNEFERYERLEERLLAVKGEITDEDFEKHVLLGKPIPNTLGKKAKDSARRSYKTVNSIIKSNIHRFTTFMTFTFAQKKNKRKYNRLNKERLKDEVNLKFDYVDGTDFELAKDALKKVMNNLRKKLKRKGLEFYYITVWELQKNGNYHFHILCSDIPKDEIYSMPKWLDYNFIEKKFNNGQGLFNWTYGKSDIQEIKSPEKVTTYVSKYIIKSFLNVDEKSYLEYLNKKKYFVSTNLDRPTIEYFDEDGVFDRYLRDLSLENIEPYVKVYTNPYNESKITNKLYTVLDKKKTNRINDSLADKLIN